MTEPEPSDDEPSDYPSTGPVSEQPAAAVSATAITAPIVLQIRALTFVPPAGDRRRSGRSHLRD